MKITADITLKYNDKKTAQSIRKSLHIDDESYVTTTVEDKIIHASISAKNLPSFLHTLDDYLSCLAVAEQIIEKKKKEKITE